MKTRTLFMLMVAGFFLWVGFKSLRNASGLVRSTALPPSA